MRHFILNPFENTLSSIKSKRWSPRKIQEFFGPKALTIFLEGEGSVSRPIDFAKYCRMAFMCS